MKYSFGPGVVRVGETLVPEAVTASREGVADAPDLTLRFEIRDGRPECVHLAVTSSPGGRGIRLSDLDVFSLDAAASRVFLVGATPVGGGPLGGRDEVEVWAMLGDLYKARTERRRPTSKATLEGVADTYNRYATVPPGSGRAKPAKAVEQAYGLDARTAARRIREAKDAGLIPAPAQPCTESGTKSGKRKG